MFLKNYPYLVTGFFSIFIQRNMTKQIRGHWEKTKRIYPWVYGFDFLTKHLKINRKKIRR